MVFRLCWLAGVGKGFLEMYNYRTILDFIGDSGRFDPSHFATENLSLGQCSRRI